MKPRAFLLKRYGVNSRFCSEAIRGWKIVDLVFPLWFAESANNQMPRTALRASRHRRFCFGVPMEIRIQSGNW